MSHSTSWPEGLSFEAYLDQVNQLAKEGKTSGDIQNDSMVYYTKLGAARMRRLHKTFSPADFWPGVLQNLTREFDWKVFTESWCGDAAQSLPVMQKIAGLSGGKINLEVFYRDEHPDLFNQYLTAGSRSIPKLVAFDRATGEELGTWGPRPDPLQERVLIYRQAPDKSYDEFAIEVQQWYNENEGVLIQEELLRHLQAWEQKQVKVG